MSKQNGENHGRKKHFLESGKPTYHTNIEEENPTIDAASELDKIAASLRRTHKEDQKRTSGKAWVDKEKTKKEQTSSKNLNL